ncbi:MAG: hypothetical protein J5984_03130 [Clostridia bacterium]|nr:hypothetical protein [Clostridia bacterium]
MTTRFSKHAIIIDNIKSDSIEQAIFILKSHKGKALDRDIVAEAQDIVDRYAFGLRKTDFNKSRMPFRFFGYLAIGVSLFLFSLFIRSVFS